MISDGANVDHQTPYGDTPLVVASRAGQLEAVRLLVDSGADVQREQPLLFAAGYGHTDIVAFLIDNGANVNAHDYSIRYTALYRYSALTPGICSTR